MSAEQWRDLDVPAMWSAAQCADTAMAWDQVVAWQRTAELYFEYERHLRACREDLVASTWWRR